MACCKMVTQLCKGGGGKSYILNAELNLIVSLENYINKSQDVQQSSFCSNLSCPEFIKAFFLKKNNTYLSSQIHFTPLRRCFARGSDGGSRVGWTGWASECGWKSCHRDLLGLQASVKTWKIGDSAQKKSKKHNFGTSQLAFNLSCISSGYSVC